MGTSSSSAKASSSKTPTTKSGSAWLDAVKAVSNSGAAGAAGGAGGGVAGDSSDGGASVTTGAGGGAGAAAGASSSATTTTAVAATTTTVPAKEPVKLPPTVERKPSGCVSSMSHVPAQQLTLPRVVMHRQAGIHCPSVVHCSRVRMSYCPHRERRLHRRACQCWRRGAGNSRVHSRLVYMYLTAHDRTLQMLCSKS